MHIEAILINEPIAKACCDICHAPIEGRSITLVKLDGEHHALFAHNACIYRMIATHEHHPLPPRSASAPVPTH